MTGSLVYSMSETGALQMHFETASHSIVPVLTKGENLSDLTAVLLLLLLLLLQMLLLLPLPAATISSAPKDIHARTPQALYVGPVDGSDESGGAYPVAEKDGRPQNTSPRSYSSNLLYKYLAFFPIDYSIGHVCGHHRGVIHGQSRQHPAYGDARKCIACDPPRGPAESGRKCQVLD